MWQEKISIAGPYHFDLALERLSLDPLHVVDLENRSVKVPITTCNRQLAAEVKGVGTLEEPAFIVKANNDKEEVLERLGEVFSWNDSLHYVHDHFMKTDLKSLFQEHYGTPIVLDFDPLGCLFKCIIHQQLNLKFAYTLTERFVHRFGKQIDGVWFYPSAEKVAALEVSDLRQLQFSGRKAEYVIGIAERAASGQLDFTVMKNQSDEEIAKQLIKIRGVGPWTVQNFLMFGLGRRNLFPIADIGLQNALKKYYSLDVKPTKEEMEQLKPNWEPYLSYASLYLWRSIE